MSATATFVLAVCGIAVVIAVVAGVVLLAVLYALKTLDESGRSR